MSFLGDKLIHPFPNRGFWGNRPIKGASWTVDAASGIATPISSAEWTAFLTASSLSAITVPDALWLFQEASGNPADAISSFTLTASGTGLSYQQTISGWSRKAISFVDGDTGQLKSTSTSLPDISTTSQFTVMFGVTATPIATRHMLTQGTTRAMINIATGHVITVISGVNTANGTSNPTGSVKPFGLRSNHTASSTTGFTDADKVTPTFGTVSGKNVCFGADGAASSAMSVLYGWQWNGANAEISDANYKALLQAMGFTITWT